MVYAIIAGSSLYLIDAGWESDPSMRALEDGLAVAGAAVEDITGVAVTHAHPDHYGLSLEIRQRAGAWIGLHHRDLPLLAGTDEDLALRLRQDDAWLAGCGAPAPDIREIRSASTPVLARNRTAPPDRLLDDGDVLRWGDHRFTVLHTPGHTPGHVCLVDRDRRIIFTGDHLLPTSSSNVSSDPRSGPDPLDDHLHSLQRVRRTSATTAFPAHGAPFNQVGPRATEIVAHHLSQMDEIEQLAHRRDLSTWDIARSVRWSRPWDHIEPFLKRAAVAETLAHLVRLERAGRVRRTADHPLLWRATTGE